MHTAWLKYEGQRWQLSLFSVNSFRNVFYQQRDLYRSQDSSVSVIVTFMAGQAWVLFLAGIGNMSLFQNICTSCRAHLASCAVGTGSSLPRGEEVRVWKCTSSSPCLPSWCAQGQIYILQSYWLYQKYHELTYASLCWRWWAFGTILQHEMCKYGDTGHHKCCTQCITRVVAIFSTISHPQKDIPRSVKTVSNSSIKYI